MNDNYEKFVEIVEERLKWAFREADDKMKAHDEAVLKRLKEDAEVVGMVAVLTTLHKKLRDMGVYIILDKDDKPELMLLPKTTWGVKFAELKDEFKFKMLTTLKGNILSNAIPTAINTTFSFESLKDKLNEFLLRKGLL